MLFVELVLLVDEPVVLVLLAVPHPASAKDPTKASGIVTAASLDVIFVRPSFFSGRLSLKLHKATHAF